MSGAVAKVTSNRQQQQQVATTQSAVSGRTVLAVDPHRSSAEVRAREAMERAVVLDDDTYVNTARAIIERDFFPDLARLRARTAWIEARERNDLPALMQMRQQFGRGARRDALAQTPLALQTPVVDDDGDATATATLRSTASDLPSLNEFVATHVTEDDAAYADLAERDHRAFRERVAWIEESAIKADRQLAVTDAARSRLNAAPFEVRNSLMWYPHGIDSADPPAAAATAAESTRAIARDNTRFAVPAPVSKRRRVAAEPPVAVDAATAAPPDYSYLQSPRMEPGVDVAPIMTWGKIGSTPQRLHDGPGDDESDESDDEDERMLLATFGRGDKGPIGQFKVADTPVREATAHSLANAAVERRVRAQAARRTVAKSPRPTTTVSGRIALSPAAARLAQSLTPRQQRNASLTASLRAAFTPTPVRPK